MVEHLWSRRLGAPSPGSEWSASPATWSTKACVRWLGRSWARWVPQRSWSESSLEPSEALALVLQLFSGPLADRSGRYWSLTILGYTMTPVCVPLLAAVPFVDSLGLALAATLILLERAGKAIRSPSKSALLARVAGAVGSGRGFAVQKAMDQVEAFAGPVLVAAVTGMQWPAFARDPGRSVHAAAVHAQASFGRTNCPTARPSLLITLIAVAQVVSAVLLLVALRRRHD